MQQTQQTHDKVNSVK